MADLDSTHLDPDEIAGHGFNKSRKGYETDEVRAYLVALGSQVRTANREAADMGRRLAELERRATDLHDLDEVALTELLGEETVRVLETARQAAREIRTKADDNAVTTTRAAVESAAVARQEADAYGAEVRRAADEAAEQVQSAADAYAADRHEAADTDTKAQRENADTYAAELRATVEAEVSELRSTAEAEIAELREAAASILGERTSEAEAVAGTIRSDATAYGDQVRADADHHSNETRAAADTYAADQRGEADSYLTATTAEADRLRAEAESHVAATRSDVAAETEAQRATAVAEAERIVDEAREHGRDMVQEARIYRERVISDLAERRRVARSEIADLAATRDRLAVTLIDVAAGIDAAHEHIQALPIDVDDIGDPALDRRALDPEPSREPIGVGELGLGASAADDDLAVDEDGPAATADGADRDDDPDAVGSSAGPETMVVEVVRLDDRPAAPHEPATLADEVDGEEVANHAGDDAPAIEDGGDADAPGTDGAGAAEGIFARLRAADATDGDAVGGGPDTEAVPVTAVEPAAEPVDDGAAGGASETDAVDADADLLDRRDAAADEVERQLARRLKRVLSDEQNEALDLLRRTKGTPDADAVIPSEADHLARYMAAAQEDLVAAERAGASFFGPAPDRAADVDDVATEFATEMVRQIRSRLHRAFEDGGDEQEVGERIRACYREWKTQRIADTARHFVIVAFSRGVAEAAPDGRGSRWLVDDGDAPCPDCDDNALAGPTPKGEPFPTGDLCPPAHPGCRCVAVPVGV